MTALVLLNFDLDVNSLSLKRDGLKTVGENFDIRDADGAKIRGVWPGRKTGWR